MKFDILKTLKFGFITLLLICIVFSSKAFEAKFYSVNSLYGISMRELNSVCEDDNGFIWASSKVGILRLTKDSYRIYQLTYKTPNAF